MIRTIEATIDEQGTVLLQEAVALTAPHRALVTILDEEPYSNATALLSEAALAEDWNRPEEDVEAYSRLATARPARQFGCGHHLLSGAGINVNDLLATPVEDVSSENMPVFDACGVPRTWQEN